VLTPLLMVIIMITGDFLSMSFATDRVRPSETPNSWEIGKITMAGAILGACFLAFLSGMLVFGKFHMQLDLDHLRTFCVIALVFGSQAVTYAIRERRQFFGLRPTAWLVASSSADMLFISVLANRGIAMSSLAVPTLLLEFLAAACFGLLINALKIPVFSRLRLN